MSKDLHLSIEEPFGNLYRMQTVLIACTDDQGQIIVTGKEDYYPVGINRLGGGGVKPGERPGNAALREVEEELGVKDRDNSLSLLARVFVSAQTEDYRRFLTQVWIYHLYVGNDLITPGDDVSEVSRLSVGQMNGLVDRYYGLSRNIRRVGDGENFNWRDYGVVYGHLHSIALQGLTLGGFVIDNN